MLLAHPSSPVIEVTRHVVVQAPLAAVFAFVADLRNDAQWRKEVHQTLLNAPAPAVGCVATEDAYLSARCPHSLTQLAYVDFQPEHYVRCTAVSDNGTWTDVERAFKLSGPAATQFTYTLRFEQNVVRQALGFAPPVWFLRWYTGWMMQRYLKVLKQLLETAHAGKHQQLLHWQSA